MNDELTIYGEPSGKGSKTATHAVTAVVAVKAAIPILLILALMLPMVVMMALPNILFGYLSSQLTGVSGMTGLAAAMCEAFMGLPDYEDTRITNLITLQCAGNLVTVVTVRNRMTQLDLMWLMAIGAVFFKQDLNGMTVADVTEFYLRSVEIIPLLVPMGYIDGVPFYTLIIIINRKTPEKFMETLGFNEQRTTWSGAIFETLSESDALNKHPELFTHDGGHNGTSFDGSFDHGPWYNTDIDTSGFIDPATKNNHDLAAYAIQAWENNWGYVWGTYGRVLTPALLSYKVGQYPDGVGANEEYIRKHYLNRRTTDCVGLIKGYGWLSAEDGEIHYGTNGMPDKGANSMFRAAKDGEEGVDYGSIETMPDIVGLAVWMNGHIGVYIGNGYVIEAMGTKYGVVRTALAGRGWTGWCKIPYIEYDDGEII